MYVNPRYAERELPVLHEMIEAAPFGLRERGGDDDRAIVDAMMDYPYASQEPRGDR